MVGELLLVRVVSVVITGFEGARVSTVNDNSSEELEILPAESVDVTVIK